MFNIWILKIIYRNNIGDVSFIFHKYLQIIDIILLNGTQMYYIFIHTMKTCKK